MTYVVTQACIRCKYTECVEVCPQQAFREGANFVVIDPNACANCALCEIVCPIGAIKPDYGLDGTEQDMKVINARYAALWPCAMKREPMANAAQWVNAAAKLQHLDPNAAG